MISRIILSRTVTTLLRHPLYHRKSTILCFENHFRSSTFSCANKIGLQTREFSLSSEKNGILGLWGSKENISNETAENVVEFSSTMQDISLNKTGTNDFSDNLAASSSVDNFPMDVTNTDKISNVANISPLNSTPDATTFADFGLGGSILPHKLFQDILDYMHTTVGLEWIPAIALLTVVLRTLTIPCVVSMRRFSARSSNLFPQTMKLQQDMSKAMSERNTFLAKKTKMEYQTFMLKNKINPFRALFINLPNMIVFSSMFFCLRQISNAQVPSLVDGGVLWFTNLSIPDPYMILPLLSCLSMAAIIRSGAADAELGPTGQVKGVRKFLMWMPVISLPFLIYQPSAIFAFWITSNVFSCLLLPLFRNKAVLKFFNIPELIKHDIAVEKHLENSMNPIAMFKKAKQQQAEAKALLEKVENYKKEMEKMKEFENKKQRR